MKKIILAVIFFISAVNLSNAQTYNDFTLNDLEGNEVKLSELLKRGPVMISFWATWCAPCKEEMQKMEVIYNKYKEQGFQYVAINQDSPKSLSKVKSFVASRKLPFIVVLDPDKKVFEKYNGQGVPYSLIINSNKEIVAKHIGYVTGDEKKIEKEIKSILVDR